MTEEDYFNLGLGIFLIAYIVFILPMSLEARIDFLYDPFDDEEKR